MKRKPQIDAEEGFDSEAFIRQAAATQAERLPRSKSTERRTTGRGRMPAEGFTRTSLDLPDNVYERLKIAAVKERRTMRECIQEAVLAWLGGR